MKKIKDVFNKIVNIIEERKAIDLICILLYVYFVIILAITHELSEDEMQSWLISRDLNYIQIINQMKYEGHSFLWHYLISPLSKLGFPSSTQKIIPVIFSSMTILVLWLKAPLKKYLKIITTFSIGMLYWYGCFARPYCIIPFLLVLIASIYPNRYNHPYKYALLLGLLANTHIIILPLVFLLALFYWCPLFRKKNKLIKKEETKKYIKSLLLFLSLLSIIMIIAIIGYFHCEITSYHKFENVSEYLLYIKDTYAITTFQFSGINNYTILYILLALLSLIGTIKNFKKGIIFISEALFIFLIHSFIWFPIQLRVYMIIYILLFIIWIDEYDIKIKKKKRNYYFIVAFILMNIITYKQGYTYITNDFHNFFSSGKLTSTYIDSNIEENSVFVCNFNDLQQLIIGYLPKDKYKFYSVKEEKFITYTTWNENLTKKINPYEILKSIIKFEDQSKNVYLISQSNLINIEYFKKYPNIFKIHLLYKTDNSNFIKNDALDTSRTIFYIYKIDIDRNSEYEDLLKEWKKIYK